MAGQVEVIEISNPNLIPQNGIVDIAEIPVIDSTVPHATFFDTYPLRNTPCVIKNCSQYWPCTKLWLKENELNFPYLTEKYGTEMVPVADCEKKYYNAQQKSESTFTEFLTYFKNVWSVAKNERLFYLKDWHLRRLSKDNFYDVPKYFASDWLNEYLTGINCDDYMFVYMGPTGTWTPFHVDVFTSFSWSVNVCGRKRWRLFAPGEEDALRDDLGNLPYDISEIDYQVPHFEVIQEVGDAVFVPSGWHHQVWNIDNTISINHNWVNGCNIGIMFETMCQTLVDVEEEIADCKDMVNWEQQCQKILEADFGINFAKFYNFIRFIGNRRMIFLKTKQPYVIFNKFKIGRALARFDLLQIRKIMYQLNKFESLFEQFPEKPYDFIKNINSVLVYLG